jgi:hypothetical protein
MVGQSAGTRPPLPAVRLSALGPVSGRQSDLEITFGVFFAAPSDAKSDGIVAFNCGDVKSGVVRLDAEMWRRAHIPSRHPQPPSSRRHAAGLPSALPLPLPQQGREREIVAELHHVAKEQRSLWRRRRLVQGASPDLADLTGFLLLRRFEARTMGGGEIEGHPAPPSRPLDAVAVVHLRRGAAPVGIQRSVAAPPQLALATLMTGHQALQLLLRAGEVNEGGRERGRRRPREDASIRESAQGDVEPRPTSPCTGLPDSAAELDGARGRRKGELRATAELAGARGPPRARAARRKRARVDWVR